MGKATLALSAAILWAACSSTPPVLPTAPTPPVTIVNRAVDLTGVWTGSYTISSCSPTNAPNRCTGYMTPGTITLQLTQSGSSLDGTFQSTKTGAMDVRGAVSSAGAITLTGERHGIVNCFSIGPPITGLTASIGEWAAEVTKSGAIVGAFKQFTLQTISSCYKTMYQYTTEIPSLTRAPIS